MSQRLNCGAVLMLCAFSFACAKDRGVSGTGGSGGAGGAAGMAGTGGSGATGGTGGGTATTLTGTLGDLGATQPTVSSFVISNSGEMLIYMSSAPLTCAQIMVSRWLGSVTSGAQVVEVIVPASSGVGTVSVADGAEVNYAPGGMSSAYEQNADSGSVTLTMVTPNGPVEGTFNATYTNPTANVGGTFHAEFCVGGQGY